MNDLELSSNSETDLILTESTKLARENLIYEYEDLYTKISGLNQLNLNLEGRINQYFKKKMVDINEPNNKGYFDQEEEDPIQRLNNLFALYKQVKENNQKKIQNQTEIFLVIKKQTEDLKLKVENMNKLFNKRVFEKIDNVKYTNIPKASLLKNLESIFATDRHNNLMMSDIRVKNLRLIKKINHLKHSDSSSTKINKMELERIKIQNHAYNSRIEKRSDDTNRLLKKLESNSNVIAHINEATFQYENKLDVIDKKSIVLDRQITSLKENALMSRKEKDKLRKNYQGSKIKWEFSQRPEFINFYKDMIEKNKHLNEERTKKINIIKALDNKAYKLQNDLIKQCEMNE